MSLLYSSPGQSGTDACLPVSPFLLPVPPSSVMQWTNQMRLSHKLLGKHKLNCNASDCCFYPNYCYYHQNFVKIGAIGSKERYLSPFTSKSSN